MRVHQRSRPCHQLADFDQLLHLLEIDAANVGGNRNLATKNFLPVSCRV